MSDEVYVPVTDPAIARKNAKEFFAQNDAEFIIAVHLIRKTFGKKDLPQVKERWKRVSRPNVDFVTPLVKGHERLMFYRPIAEKLIEEEIIIRLEQHKALPVPQSKIDSTDLRRKVNVTKHLQTVEYLLVEAKHLLVEAIKFMEEIRKHETGSEIDRCYGCER